MFDFIKKKIFIKLLTSIVNFSYHTKHLSLSNQKCTIQPILLNLHPSDYTQGLSQPANIGPQDVPRTSPSNVSSTSPKDPI